jgi:hypothetical protein
VETAQVNSTGIKAMYLIFWITLLLCASIMKNKFRAPQMQIRKTVTVKIAVINLKLIILSLSSKADKYMLNMLVKAFTIMERKEIYGKLETDVNSLAKITNFYGMIPYIHKYNTSYLNVTGFHILQKNYLPTIHKCNE